MGAAGTLRRTNSQVKGGGGDSGVARGRGKCPPGKGGWDNAERRENQSRVSWLVLNSSDFNKSHSYVAGEL